MIHVLCLNPAIDKIYRIPGFAAGEDYPGQRPRLFVGGKGVNVARVLSQLGERVHLYAFLGETGGEAVRREMQARCACTFISVPGACRTTVNIVDPATGRETVITEAGPRVDGGDVAALMDALCANVRAGDMVCCSGSIIAGAPEDIYARVSRLCEERGAACALDANVGALRGTLGLNEVRGEERASAGEESARPPFALGKPNERELCALLSEERTQDAGKIVRLARRLMPPYGALLVSMGAAGGVWVTPEAAYAARVPETDVVSTVGSGDASFAGALCAMSRGLSAPDALRLAMACGVVNAARGENGSVDAQEVGRAMQKIEVETVG